jgi:hypothetical protein
MDSPCREARLLVGGDANMVSLIRLAKSLASFLSGAVLAGWE